MKFSFSSTALLMKSLLISLSLFTLFGAIAINHDSQAQAKQAASVITRNFIANLTIAEIVAQSGGEYDNNDQDFDILLNALKQTGLVDSLADKSADLTVFAPTDATFLKLSRTQFGYNGIDEAAVIDAINEEFSEYKRIDIKNGGFPNYEPFKLRDMLLSS